MARIPEAEIERLKTEISVARLVEAAADIGVKPCRLPSPAAVLSNVLPASTKANGKTRTFKKNNP